MSIIQDCLNKIKNAVFGEEVRQSIIDSINQCYKDATGHPESVASVINEIENVKQEQAELSSEIDEKMNKNSILSMANMGQDIKEAMTGGSVAVVGRETITDINIVDGVITIDKLTDDFKEKTGNLLKLTNYDEIEGDISLNNNRLNVRWNGQKSTIIKVLPVTLNANVTYYVHFDSKFSDNQIQFELRDDKAGENKIVSYIKSGQTTIAVSKDVDFNLNYIRLSGSDINFDGHIWVDTNLKGSYYPPYISKLVTKDDVKKINEEISNISAENLNDEISNILFDRGKYNLYNKKTAEIGKAIDSLGNITDNDSTIISDYIDIEEFFETEQYIWFKQSADKINIINGNAQYVAFYDNNKRNICSSAKQFYNIGYIGKEDLPSGYKYLRVSFAKEYVNFGVGGFNAPLFNYFTGKELVDRAVTDALKEQIEEINSASNSLYLNKKCIFYGDSITAQDLFQKNVKEKTGMDYINDGNPGYPMSNVFKNNPNHSFSLTGDYKMNALVNTINTEKIEYVFIMAGTNDFGYDGTREPSETEGEFNTITIGDLSHPYNRNTYKGALSNVIDRITRECESVEKIFIMSPIQRGKEGATDIVKNAIGLSMYDFRNACEDVANKFSCEFIDIYNSGINFINWAKYIPDKIHPNELGAELIAYKIISYLKNMNHKVGTIG